MECLDRLLPHADARPDFLERPAVRFEKLALFGKLGQEFDFIPAGNRYDLPPFYALHAWIWKPNPSGILYAWNPRVDCS